MADELRFLTQSHSYDFNNTPNFQFLSCIILHDLSLLCSFVVSYPLYTSYFIFFSPYLLRIISFISPLFIAIILLSLLLTTTTAFCPKLPQLELEILQTVLHELKSNLDHLSGNGEECNFEIYNFVFDSTLSTMIGYEGVDQIEEEGEELFGDEGVDPFEEERRNVSMKKVLEDSVHGGRRNDITTSELYIDKFEEENSLVKLISRLPEKNLSMKETVLEDSVHGGRRYEITTSDLDMDKFEEKNDLVKLISRRPEKNLSLKEIIPEKPVHGGRRNDLTTSDLDNDKSKEENDLVKLFEELDRFEEFPTAIETGTDSDKVIGELRKAEPTPATEVRSGSEAESVAIDSNDNDKITQNSGRDAVKVDKSSSWRSNSSSFFGSHGSMKEEKEWRRTLACN
ncbi:hypothetical protein Ccrd_017899 [Cynara cardunculus var. scolymus]|uniref:Uncharacterized protein n=1 Tax=Cynara cardunculus var. scolymus TaxID=59895 RepID=A0A124SFN2_CYNCS|nr:hypothetical protein Ccrd_017899 [Cynara cardunculus var. scolymus]